MMNIAIENKGTITLGEKVMVSDPCYGLGTWCQGVLKNVLPGQYDCSVEYSDEGDWGTRVSAIEVTHESCKGKFIFLECEDFEVGVDSGTAGIFDYEYYAKYHRDAKESEHVDDYWYDRTGDLTFVTKKNPDYVDFHWDENADDMSEQYRRYREWTKDVKKSWPTIQCFDGNTIDGLGFVSSSGYGDGGYNCWTAKNEDGKIIAIRVEFITEYDDYEEDEYEDF